MGHIAANIKDRDDSSEFAALLGETLGKKASFEGSVVKGRIVAVLDDVVVVDVGLKSEGRVSLREFSMPGQDPEIQVGDVVEVFVERLENRQGEAVLSREKARREEVWVVLEKSHEKQERVTGIIFGKVKGGFTVDLGGAVAFLPGSQVDIRPIKDITPIMGTPQPFQILKMDRVRGNIVVSRRAILEESRDEARSDILSGIREGQIIQGVVKNITDYGAFIDLGGVDGLLHVTDISWKRVSHPSEALTVGQSVDVQVIKFNTENGRISLGMKQLESDPWSEVISRYTKGDKVAGKVTNLADYGAFVELGEGVEGLVHVSELSWTKKNIHPSKLLKTGDEVQVMVLDIDTDKRRISLGLKQCQPNPWASFAENRKEGDTLEGEIRNITEFGLFVSIGDEIDGMVHLSDLAWDKAGDEAVKDYTKGQMITVKILDIDPEKERVALGVKQLTEDPYKGQRASSPGRAGSSGVPKGAVVTCTVTEINDKGIEVKTSDGATGFIKKADLSKERSEQRSDRFAVGEKVDAKVLTVDAKSNRLNLSIKAREIDEDKEAMAAFGSTESGASLGDILGAALHKEGGSADASAEKPKKKTTKAKKTASDTGADEG